MKINTHIRIKAINRIIKKLSKQIDQYNPFGYSHYEISIHEELEYWEDKKEELLKAKQLQNYRSKPFGLFIKDYNPHNPQKR